MSSAIGLEAARDHGSGGSGTLGHAYRCILLCVFLIAFSFLPWLLFFPRLSIVMSY